MLSKLNNELISSKQRSPAPLENDGVYKYLQSLRAIFQTVAEKQKALIRASFSLLLCVKQLMMNKADHRTPVWALSCCQPRALCAATCSVDIRLSIIS